MSNFPDPTNYNYLEQTKDFEQSRIKTLQQERINVQKKTFTKWCNSFLTKYGMEIDNLFKDLEDGKRLIKLLEIISGEKLGKPNQGRLKVHKIENVNKALNMVQSKIKLESIGAEDIVSGNATLILGLIWTIILRFQIQDIIIDVDDSHEKRSAKDALLLWCQRKTAGYAGVKIVDFSNSWRNGMAFNALIHSQRQDLIDYDSLNPNDHLTNLNCAFDLAQKHLGIAKLLDPEDIDVDRPDEKSIITYVSFIYHTFAKMKNEAVGGKRIGKIVGYLMDIDRTKDAYENDMTNLMAWINKNIRDLSNFEFPNSLDGIKALMLVFCKEYMVLHKPPKCKQKILIVANFYSINMKLNAQGHPNYTPPEGKTVSDLENAWSRLEKVEHERDLALKRELHRQEKLEQIYEKFDKKAKLREDWISDMAKVLSNSSSFSNSSQLDATFKKLEALSSDFNAGSDRFKRLDQLAQELIQEDYFSKDTVYKRNQKIQSAFNNLIDQFEKRKASMATYQELEFLFQEMENLNIQMLDLEKAFQSKDYGEYLLDADELITKHGILESQISGISQHLKSVKRRAQQFMRSSSFSAQSLTSSPNSSLSENASKTFMNEAQLVKEKLDNLVKALELIIFLCGERRQYLNEHRNYLKFLEEADEEIIWIQEKIRVVKSNDAGHDLGSTQILINKHEQLEDEIKFRSPRIDKITDQSEKIINSGRFGQNETDNIVKRMSEMQALIKQLKELAAKRKSLLEDSFSSQQYFADANEAEYWMKDKLALVSLNSDCGKDEASSQALLNRHVRIQEEIKAYEAEIKRLNEITEVLIGNRRFSSFPADIKQQLMKNQKRNALASTGEIPTDTDDFDDSESDYSMAASNTNATAADEDGSFIDEVEFVDQIVEKEVTELVSVQTNVNCVKALYAFSSKHFSMQRAEIMELKEKTNGEWWLLVKSNGLEGYAPANYVKEIGIQNFSKQQKKTIKRPQLVKVEKIVRKPDTKQNDKKKKASLLRRKTTSVQPRQLQHLNTENLQKRQVDIKFMFNQLFNSSIERRKQLDNTIAFYKWLRKYEEFSKWVGEKLEEMSLSNQESLLENPDSSKRLYQTFITDFLAYQNEFGQIEKLADELVSKKLTYVIETSKKAMSHGEIKHKQNQLAEDYKQLLELKKTWDDSIKAFQSIQKYNSMYAEVNELVREKLASIQREEVADENDVRSVRALQKKQDKMERELGPIEKNMFALEQMALEVSKYFPQEKINVARKQKTIGDEWHRLREEVKNRKAKLDEKHGLKRFENECDDFRLACASLLSQLNDLTEPRDLKQQEEMKSKFDELDAEFKNELVYKFNSLKELGQNLLSKRGAAGSVEKINSGLSHVTSIKCDTADSLEQTNKYLDDYQKYLKFKQDASAMQLLMQDQEAYLQFDDVGSSSSNVDALQKRHDEFIAKLNAQDDKIKMLADQLAKLTANKHFGAQTMQTIFQSLTQKRQKLKQSALDRKLKLAKSKEFYEFKIQCDDLNSWIGERRAVVEKANAESSSLAHLQKSMNKHEAIEKELISNRTRLDRLIVDGARLSKSIVNEKVQELICVVEKNWLELEKFTKLKGNELQRAKQKTEMNLKVNDVHNRVASLEQELNKNYAMSATSDLRSAKQALKKHLELKKQIAMEIELLNDMHKDNGHLKDKNKDNKSMLEQQEIEQALQVYMNAYSSLSPVFEQKQKSLETELGLQQLMFDLDQETQWIDESTRQIDLITQTMAQTLFEAKNKSKKLAEIDRIRINNHQTIYTSLVERSKLILNEPNVENKLVNSSCNTLEKLAQKTNQFEMKWTELDAFLKEKMSLVAKCLIEQEQYEELNQIDIFLNEKMPILTNVSDDSLTESSIGKNLTKLDHLSNDLFEHKTLLVEREACSDFVKAKIDQTRQKLDEMMGECEAKKAQLARRLEVLEFERESGEFMRWMNEKRVQAQSEEFGQDFEHLLLICDKFDLLRDEIKLSDAKYERLRERAGVLLSTKGGADSKLIHKRNDELKATHDQLLNELAQRQVLLGSAAEIHRFNKDAQDLNRRMSEKEASFVSDVGRDLNSCEFFVRKHQTYMDELSALKIHLNDLNKESEVLRAKHPGSDTDESILSEMNDLIDRFNKLRLKSEQRTRDLAQSRDYYKFIVQSKDLSRWMDQIRCGLLTTIQPSDLYSVLRLREEHDNVRSEMSQRDDMFQKLEDLCTQIGRQKDNPYSKEVVLQTSQVMKSREALFELWTLRNRALESQNDCHEFYRDVNQFVLLISSQESVLTKSINELEHQLNNMSVLIVEDLERVAKTSQNLEKKIQKQSLEKAIDLKKKGAQLLDKQSARLNSPEVETYGLDEMARLKDILNLILKKENDMRELCRRRANQLNDTLRFFRLYRDIDEFEMWIDDRIRSAKALCQRSQTSSVSTPLSEQIKLFQRQKALKGEIESNFATYTQLNERGKDELASNGSVSEQQIRATLQSLNKKWQSLAYEINEREKEFAEARDILEYNDELERLDEWLKDKELMIQNGEVGHDYEHCMVLLKKVEDTMSPQHEHKLKKLIEMGDKLVRSGRSEQAMVGEKNNRLAERSGLIQNGITAYRQKLAAALDLHLLMRDLDDIDQRIMDKINVLLVDVEHKSLDSVQAAQTKLNELKSELNPIKEKLEQVKNEPLLVSPPDTLTTKLDQVNHNWLSLNQLVEAKSDKLDSIFIYQKFMVEYREMKSWIWDMGNRIEQQSEPTSLSEAETAINLHQERMTEIEGKAHRLISLRETGRDLIEQKSNNNETNHQLVQKETSNLIKDIHQLAEQLQRKAFNKQIGLEQCADYLELRESWRQVENWSNQMENWLRSDECGDSVLAVKSLLVKHESVENSIKSQLGAHGSFDNVERRADEMMRAKSPHAHHCQLIVEQSRAKRAHLAEMCANRRKHLDDSLMYHNLLLNYYDVIQWVRQKTVAAMEKSYTDMSNLETKIQRHQAFMIDLNKIGQKRVEDLQKEAESLLCRHQTTLYSLSTASAQTVANINELIKDVEVQWNGLKSAAETKRKLLDDTFKYVTFTRLADDLLTWFDEVEAQLANEDNGHDTSSCKMLLLRHESLVKQIEAHGDKIHELNVYLSANRHNSMLPSMELAAAQVAQRFAALKEPCDIRLENLRESLGLFAVLHDMDDAAQWIEDKMPLAAESQLGLSLQQTEKMLKRHADLEQQTRTNQNLMDGLFKAADKLVRQKHYAHQLLSARLADLQKQWLVFRDLVSERKHKLDDALHMHKFLSDSDDFVEYMKETLRQMSNGDYGRNEPATLSYLNKLKSNDWHDQRHRLDAFIQQESAALMAREHTDKKSVQRKVAEMQTLYERVCEAADEREQHLNAMLSVFEFEREAEALLNWLRDQELVASSQDFGQDLEHAELLAKKFHQFCNYLSKNADKMQQFDDLAQQLCENKFTPSVHIEAIDQRCASVNNLWDHLNKMTNIRRKTLEGAIEVHAFDKDCDDLIAWADEKEKFLANEDIGYDLASVYTLAKQQEALENELAALGEELERLNSESKRLIDYYPAAKEHLEAKLDQADTKYNQVMRHLSQRRDTINNSQVMFVYANEFNEISEWLREMLAKLTSVEIGPQHGIGEVNSAEMLVQKHKEHKIEIDLQQAKIQKFLAKSQDFLDKGFAAKTKTPRQEIMSKIQIVRTNNNNVLETWSSRQELYEQNLEYNKLLREIKYLDTWLSSKDAYVHTDLLGDSLSSVETLLKQHEDFERMLNAMENRFGNLRVENRLEKKMKEIKEREAANRIKADAQFEEERKKDAERKRKLEQRRQDERRRTQEIIANVAHNQIAANVSSSVGSTELNKNLEIKTDLESMTKQINSPINNNTGVIRKKDRNRTRSIRDKYKILIGLTAPTIADYLMRKQEYQKGGQRAPIRDYNELNAASQPINLFNCSINRIEDTTIQRDVIHVETADGAEYLFDAAGDDYDEEKMDLWLQKIFESSASPSRSALNTNNLTGTQYLNDSTGDLSSLSTQTPNKPRSRAPVMSLPPIKSESIDIDIDKEDHYARISSPLNRSTEAQREPIYENVPKNNSFKNVEETFLQDSFGQISANKKSVSFDKTDIEFRRQPDESIAPVSPVSIGSLSDKVGHLESTKGARKPLISIIKADPKEDKKLLRPSSAKSEALSEPTTPRKMDKESIINRVLNQAAINSSLVSADDMRHTSYNQAIQTKKIENEANYVKSLVEKSAKSGENLNISAISDISDNSMDSVDLEKQQTSNLSDQNTYGIRNLVTSEQKAQTLPSNMDGTATGSNLESKSSFMGEKDAKSKKNFLGSLFKKKKGKYDVKSENKTKDKK